MASTASNEDGIAVAGAGIAGLTAAICLAQQGFAVRVFEKAPEFREIGAGIQLSPNAIHVLRRIGLDVPLADRAIETEAIDIRDAGTGRLLTSIPLQDQCARRYGAPYLVVHRADLMDVLLTAAGREPKIIIQTGAEVSNVVSRPDGVSFSGDGDQMNAALFLAADGVHSSIRLAVTGQAAEDLKQTAWRATIADPGYDDILPATRTGLWLGDGVHLVHYPLRAGRELNLVLIGHATVDSPKILLKQYTETIRGRLSGVEWLAWPLMQVDAAGSWVQGRIAFLGDAAHAMLPTAAQGGAQAIEDAFVLARCLKNEPGNPVAALSNWQQRRKARVQRVARQAQRNLQIYGLAGLAASARNLAIRAIPGKQHLSRFDWLYGWQPD